MAAEVSRKDVDAGRGGLKSLAVGLRHSRSSPAERRQIQQEKVRPLLDEFEAWLDKSANQVPPKTALGKAVTYTLGQWEKLECYFEGGNLQIDNNRVERAVKPFVIGRKN